MSTKTDSVVIENDSRLASYGAYINEMWDRKGLVRVLASRELKSSYDMNVVGFMWWLLEPLTLTGVYFVLFSVIFDNRRENYLLVLLTALLPFKWFNQTIVQSMGTVRSHANLITDVYFTRALLPMTETVIGLAHFSVGLLVVPVLMIVMGVAPTWNLLALPGIMLVQLIFGLGLAYPMSVLGLNYRNLPNLMGNILRLWFYLSPAIWSIERVPEKYHWLVSLNPLSGLFQGYHSAILGDPWRIWDLMWTLSLGLILLAGGTYYFTRREAQFGKML
jgi:lipopolysaccharide transport system permease protein